MKIKFGPAGLGGVKEAVENLKHFKELGLTACEVAFTYGIYLKKEDAIRIEKVVNSLGIELSVHAPYWINLNSKEKAKVEASKKRILKCCEIGHYLNAKKVVFHCGFYGGKDGDREIAFNNIKMRIMEMMKEIKENKWGVELCPEIMGKKNVFGSIDEISRLVDETGCGFCIDFAHVLARYGGYEFELIKKAFLQKKWHCHFSGIDYGDKGEKNHKKTSIDGWKHVLSGIPKDKELVIINESPGPVRDSVLGLRLFNN